MSKKYKDINDIIHVAVLDKELYNYDILMKEKPNFNKSHGSQKIYKRKNYAIYKVSSGYIIHNLNKKFKEGHTHVKNFHKAKSLIDLAVRKKLPNSMNKWEISSLIRITDDVSYRNKLEGVF